MVRKPIGPGPGKYKLPSVVGYPDHDITRYRNPQYSIGNKFHFDKKSIGPGPTYNVDHMTNFGKDSPPAYSMKSRPQPLTSFQTPGPGTYRNEAVPRMKEPRPPMYSMASRHPPLTGFVTPGPDKYSVPSTLGPKVPDKHANAAYSMSYKHDLSKTDKSPGPAKYGGIDINRYKNQPPKYTISPRVYPPESKGQNPGPKYLPKLPTIPGYSFGLRTDTDPYITAQDDMPCVERKACS